jgi:hypothetical protein
MSAKQELKEKPKHTISRFTGVARSVECFENQGFKNFKILTLHIEEGEVKKIVRSDPFASFEAMIKMEMMNEISVLNLNNQWKDGLALLK